MRRLKTKYTFGPPPAPRFAKPLSSKLTWDPHRASGPLSLSPAEIRMDSSEGTSGASVVLGEIIHMDYIQYKIPIFLHYIYRCEAATCDLLPRIGQLGLSCNIARDFASISAHLDGALPCLSTLCVFAVLETACQLPNLTVCKEIRRRERPRHRREVEMCDLSLAG